ncbi:hypothetical protein BDZ97DRAFT_1661728 [Flammula alnicola]|nr:hypothetical protein BDZ97DRAFT_1661728 [Flammula alnicola]
MSTSEIDTAFDPLPQLIGRGSFADVYVLVASLVAFKQVQYESNASQLVAEFDALEHIYTTCNPDSFFCLPRPLAYNDPRDPRAFRGAALPPPHPTRTGRPGPSRPLFYPPGAPARGPSLFRLYFGKDFTNARPSRFINTSHFFLDVTRYRQVANFPEGIDDGLPGPDVVAEAMGNILGRIHFRGGFDGRDIEFVLGGNGSVAHLLPSSSHLTPSCKMRKWNGTVDAVSELVSAYSTNDPYFPPARRGDQIYEAFRNGYHAACGAQSDIADEFLSQIEALQAAREVSKH